MKVLRRNGKGDGLVKERKQPANTPNIGVIARYWKKSAKICENGWVGGWFRRACRFFQHTFRKFFPDPLGEPSLKFSCFVT